MQAGDMSQVMQFDNEEVKKAKTQGKSDSEIEAIIQKSMNSKGSGIELKFANIEKAKDILVLGVIDKLIINEKEVKFDQEYLDKKLSSLDCKTIYEKALKLLKAEIPKD